MILADVWGSRLRRAAVLFAILAGSQLGHAIVYYARFGTAAAGRQATGPHAYFPALTGGISAVLGILLMSALLVIATARTLRPGLRSRPTLRFSDLLPALFLAQLVVFIGQESIETLASTGHLPSLVELLFWGAFGQLPAAFAGAAVLSWLLARLETAWTALLAGVSRLLDQPQPSACARASWPQPAPATRLASAFPSAFRKRGPPLRSTH
jgi:hypothetical protein